MNERQWMAIGMFGLVLLLVGAFGVGGSDADASAAYRLDEAQMVAIIGDGTSCDTCVTTTKCNTRLTVGDDQCGYCDSITARNACCEAGQGTNCDYTETVVCKGDQLYVGDRAGDPGTCGTCSGFQFSPEGSCSGLQQASGDACP